MSEERRVTQPMIIAISSILSIIIGSISLLSFVQSSERRTTVIEVKVSQMEVLISKMEQLIKEIEARERKR